MHVGERIKSRRKEKKISADKLGEMINKDRATIYRYEKGDIDNVPYTIIEQIAKVLEVHPAYLMGWEQEEKRVPTSEYDYFPTGISAGLPNCIEAIEECKKIVIPDNLLGKYAGNPKIFFTNVNGESMNKIFPHNSVIAIKPVELSELKNDDIVVYSVDGEYSVKKFYIVEDKVIFRPHSTNLQFVDCIYGVNDNNLRIHGKVISYTVQLD